MFSIRLTSRPTRFRSSRPGPTQPPPPSSSDCFSAPRSSPSSSACHEGSSAFSGALTTFCCRWSWPSHSHQDLTQFTSVWRLDLEEFPGNHQKGSLVSPYLSGSAWEGRSQPQDWQVRIVGKRYSTPLTPDLHPCCLVCTSYTTFRSWKGPWFPLCSCWI